MARTVVVPRRHELAERLVGAVRRGREPVGAEADPGEHGDERELWNVFSERTSFGAPKRNARIFFHIVEGGSFRRRANLSAAAADVKQG